MKNILLVDNDNELITLFKHLDHISDINIFYYKNMDDLLLIYEKNDIDIVVINFILDFGSKFMEYILNINPMQNIITISETLDNSESKGCDYCLENHNKIRLLKPVDVRELTKLIKNFHSYKCSFYNKFTSSSGIIDVMDKIVPRFNGVEYIKESNTFHLNKYSNIVEVVQFLDEKNISYDIKDNSKIELI